MCAASLTDTDTIAAQATPTGRGGIAIIRVSGPQVNFIMQQVLGCIPAPRQATYLFFRDENNQTIDEGIALFFSAPHSFTGEDIFEWHGHGGPVLVDLLLQRLLQLGVRLARPGEFSERAFLNNKMDLTQAEAIADLINATSVQATRSAMRSLQGEFSHLIHQLTEELIYLRVYVEAAIDFTDEEIDFLHDEILQTRLTQLLHRLTLIKDQAKQSSFLRDGIQVVIAGAPNVGKSSLLNILAGKEVAIVTDIPGTTRDVLRDHIVIDGMPVHVMDTAGLRETVDVVEQEGIRRAHQALEDADLILYVMDARDAPACDIENNLEKISQNFSERPIIFIRNKIDLLNGVVDVTIENNNKNKYVVISLSVKTRAGISELLQQIKTSVGFLGNEENNIFLARRRHLDALARAQQHLQAAHAQLCSAAPSSELAAEELRLAQAALGEITGEVTSDDLLGRIFSSFCIGK